MKSLTLFIALLSSIYYHSFSQVLKFRVIDAGYSQNGEFKQGKSSNETIIIDIDKRKLTIFGNKSDEYSILNIKVNKAKDGAVLNFYTCLNEEKEQYLINHIKQYKEGKKVNILTISYTTSETPDPDDFWMYVMLPI